MSLKVGLVTSSALPELDVDDQRLFQALCKLKVDVDVVVWDNPAVKWASYGVCVIRSTWDYAAKREQYLAWAKRVAAKTSLWNPVSLLPWNTSKAYLKGLAQQGIATIDTEWLAAASQVDWDGLLERRGWDKVVIKPVVSAGGRDTLCIARDALSTHLSMLNTMLLSQDLMVQPFVPTVTTEGEYSLMFIDGAFSHAVLKQPAKGEFRSHEHFGGVIQPLTPSEDLRSFAEQVMDAVEVPTLYGRVDVLRDEAGQPRLVELELTEPSMYLAHSPQSAYRFALAIQRKLYPD